MLKHYLFTLLLCFQFLFVKAQLTGMSPNQAIVPQTIQTTITGNGIFIQTGSPSGNLFDMRLIGPGGFNIVMFDFNNIWNYWSTNVIDANTVVTEVPVPGNAPPGLYDLQVTTGDPWYPWWNQQFYSLPGAFTVLAPNGYITGTVYVDNNRNGIKDAREPGLSRYVKINPGGIDVPTDVNGNYSYPASNGNYTVSIQNLFNDYMFLTTGNDTLQVTINNANSSGNDFGFKRALVSISPNIGYKGVTTLHQIVADEPIFIPGANANGNVSQVRVYSNPNIYITGTTNVTVIDSFTIWVNIAVPSNTSIGNNLDLSVYLTNTGGYNYLMDKFNIAVGPAYISGKLFYDLNQNKVYDVNETGISGGKVSLMPDSTFAFSDNNGNFTMTSPGGIQTLKYENNLPGISLFTDSASFTFNATGNITGKNFGFISTLSDYEILVHHLYFFARCNSHQFVKFHVHNTGTVTYNSRVWLKTSPNATFVWSLIPPSSISNDTIYWDLLNMQPNSVRIILPVFAMPASGVVTATAGANALDVNGFVQNSDVDSWSSNIFCAFDPNDKAVTPPGIFNEHYTLMSDTLVNRIRFQNTGNDTAFNVVILDTLDSDLDLGTFEILESSHSVKTQLLKNGELKFSFNNIMLVDSNANEAESHGYLLYRIKAKSGLVDSTKVLNTAHIFFDFNPDVITNTTLNTLVYELPDQGPLPVQLISFTGKPEKNYYLMEWTTQSEVNNDYFDLERSSDGNEFLKQATIPGNGTTSNISEYQFRDYNIEEANYYYRLKQVDYDGETAYSEILLVKRKGDGKGLILNAYPSPFTNQLTISFSSQVKEKISIEMYDQIGKKVLDKDLVPDAIQYSLDFSENAISSGTYLLKVTTNKEVKVFKVFKK